MATLTGKSIATTYDQLWFRGTGEPSGTTGAVNVVTTENDGTDDLTTPLFLGTERVGIGESAPDAILEVNQTVANSGHAFHVSRDQADTATDNVMVRFTNTNTGDDQDVFNIQNFGDGDALTIDNDGVEQICLGASGGAYCGFGESSPSFRLDVKENRASNYVARFVNDGDDANRYGIIIQGGDDDGITGSTYYVVCTNGLGNADVGYLKNISGTFSAADSSDVRLKKDIVDTTIDGLDTVNAIKVRDFKWKSNNGEKIAGLVANELAEVFPSAVDGEPDAMQSYPAEYDKDGNIVMEAGEKILPMTISRDMLVPVLIKAVQELSVKVTVLENA